MLCLGYKAEFIKRYPGHEMLTVSDTRSLDTDRSGDDFDAPIGLAISVIGGLIVGWALGKCAEYYTSDGYGPVKKIARQSETGPATTVLG